MLDQMVGPVYLRLPHWVWATWEGHDLGSWQILKDWMAEGWANGPRAPGSRTWMMPTPQSPPPTCCEAAALANPCLMEDVFV